MLYSEVFRERAGERGAVVIIKGITVMLLPVLYLKTNGADLNGGAYFSAEGERERKRERGYKWCGLVEGGGRGHKYLQSSRPFFASSCK